MDEEEIEYGDILRVELKNHWWVQGEVEDLSITRDREIESISIIPREWGGFTPPENAVDAMNLAMVKFDGKTTLNAAWREGPHSDDLIDGVQDALVSDVSVVE